MREMDWKESLSNIFDFEETEKMGLRKGIVFYFNDWIDENISKKKKKNRS